MSKRKSKFPDSVLLNSESIPVQYINEDEWPHDEDEIGMWLTKERRIDILNDTDDRTKAITLMHEIIHAICVEKGIVPPNFGAVIKQLLEPLRKQIEEMEDDSLKGELQKHVHMLREAMEQAYDEQSENFVGNMAKALREIALKDDLSWLRS